MADKPGAENTAARAAIIAAIITAVGGIIAAIIAAVIQSSGGQGATPPAGTPGSTSLSGASAAISAPPPSTALDSTPSSSSLASPPAPANLVAEPVTVSAAILTMRVTKVTLAGGQTTIDLSISNASGNPVSIVFATTELQVVGSPTLQRNDFQGFWTNDIPGNGTINEEAVFNAIPQGTRLITLSLIGIYANHFCDACPQELVAHIPLRS